MSELLSESIIDNSGRRYKEKINKINKRYEYSRTLLTKIPKLSGQCVNVMIN